MTSNAAILKRAMKSLGLTGKALANMISVHRDDGKVTAPETVSRWLSGTNPVEPAVLGWINELLRARALSLKGSVIKWPVRKSIVIAVTNLKGGVGTTTVSQNLAVVSAYDYNLRTKHISVGERGDTRHAAKRLERCGINSEVMSYDMMLEYAPRDYEIVIVDLARDAAYEASGSDPTAFLRRFVPDLFLIPADFGDLFEAQSTRQFADISGLRAKLRFLHRPRFMSIDFSTVAKDAGFDVMSDAFCPFFIPQTVGSSSHLPQRPRGDWESHEQQCHHIDLFNFLVEEAGGELTLPGDTAASIRAMNSVALMDYIDQWTPAGERNE